MPALVSQKYIQALESLVGDVSRVRRVVIDFRSGEPPIVHIERFGDERLLDVMRAFDGVVISRIEGEGNDD